MAVRSIATSGDGDMLSSREVAARNGIPQDIMAKIMNQLVRSGILVSYQGARGGYVLARPVADLTLSSVIEAVEGPVKLVECFDPDPAGTDHCYLIDNCSVKAPLRRIEDKIRYVFDHTTMLELM